MDDSKKNYEDLKTLALAEGMSLFGVADTGRADVLPESLKGMGRAVSIGYRLSKPVLDTITDGPNGTYFFHYQRVNILLDTVSLKLCGFMQNRGFDAFPVPASQVVRWDRNNEAGFVSHKEIARLAGHGWKGRNNLLVNPEHGSQVRYASVFTDMPLETDVPYAGAGKDYCSKCGKCEKACPAGAITASGFNLEACRNKLKEFQKTRSLGQMVCGVCVKACLPKMK